MNSRLRALTRRIVPTVFLLIGAIMLGACSLEGGTAPEPTATSVAISFGPNDKAVGTLIDESQAAWDEVERWTSETRIESPSDGSSIAEPSVTTEEVVLPNNRHILNMSGENVVSEETIINGMIYMRGPLVSSSIYPDVDEETWISFSPEQVPPETALAQRVSYLTSPPEFPFATVTEETRALPASPAGEIQVNGDPCHVFTFTSAGSGPDGESIDYRIAFGDADRPCQLVREAGGIVETTTWTYDDGEIAIHPPDNAIPVDTFPSAP